MKAVRLHKFHTQPVIDEVPEPKISGPLDVIVKTVRIHGYHQQPVVDEVPEPSVKGPLDVVVKIGGAGVCRTDLHIIEGQWDAAMGTPLPYILGHENAGWVHEVGSAVTNVAVGDTVILHPTPTCGLCHACRAGDDMHCDNSDFPGLSRDGGMAEYLLTVGSAVTNVAVGDTVILHPTPTDGLCHACRAGDDMHCENSEFPGLSRDGGMAEYLLTSARACIKLKPETQPKDVAALADAYDAVAALPGVRHAEVVLEDHFASDVINDGVAAQAGFVQTFDGEAVSELHGLRADFLRKAVMAGTDQVCRPLLAAGKAGAC